MKSKHDRLVEFRYWLESSFSSEQLSQFIIQDILDKTNDLFG